ENGQLATSSDNGYNWNSYSGFPQAMATGTYYTLQDSLTYAIGNQIYSAKFDLPNATFKELKNDGLEGNRITSISAFNDSIYITTSTGVFFRSKSGFFDYKVKTK
ncbi:MAG: hypothetical protein ACKO96_28895, partial [Flammeovirgaceae bacterium]